MTWTWVSVGSGNASIVRRWKEVQPQTASAAASVNARTRVRMESRSKNSKPRAAQSTRHATSVFVQDWLRLEAGRLRRGHMPRGGGVESHGRNARRTRGKPAIQG